MNRIAWERVVYAASAVMLAAAGLVHLVSRLALQ